MQRRFDVACRKAGIARRTVKETRHSFATLGLVCNVPVEAISEALGHPSVQMTYDVYSHVIPGLQEVSLAPSTGSSPLGDLDSGYTSRSLSCSAGNRNTAYRLATSNAP